MTRRCVEIALLSALAMLAVPASASATFPGSNGKIAFGGGTNIHRVNSDGSNQELLRAGINPVWSSDGSKIAYISGTARTDISIMNPDGTNPTLVCTCIEGNDGGSSLSAHLTWSPDGTHLAYDDGPSPNPPRQITRVNVDGTGETALTSSGSNRYPAWSPDGTKIAFVSDRAPAGIWVMNADGTGQVGLGTNGATRWPSWSPDGTKLVFQRDRVIVSMNADGSNQVELTARQTGFDTHPTWSPDGQFIAFIRGDVGETVMDADGSNPTVITTIGYARADWQPIPPSYPRPKGATPLTLSLVPAAQQCTSPNRTHGPPLAFGSCNPPQRASSHLTVGTPDANGQVAASTGSLKATVVVGNPSTQTDEADVQLSLSLTDVRRASDLSDYAGELSAQFVVRRTDKENEPFNSTPGTMVDRTFSFDAACTPSAGPEGATCAAQTSADALVPSTVQEGRRAIWELGQGRVFDGGPDGDAATQDNTLFAVGGVFVP